MTHSLETLVTLHANDSSNPLIALKLAEKYDELGQTAAAISFYLRAAEYGYDSHRTVTYSALLRASVCFEHLQERGVSVNHNIMQAIAYWPERPEAFLLMSKFHEKNKNWQESYTFALIGQSNDGIWQQLDSDVGYHGLYTLLFQQGVAAWHVGRAKESENIMLGLLTKHRAELAPAYKVAIINNLEKLNVAI